VVVLWRGNAILSTKEAMKVCIMGEVLKGGLTIKRAAEYRDLSERRVNKLEKGMKERGVEALIRSNKGRKAKHAVSQETKDMDALPIQGECKSSSYA
jgi:hypothetical protein